MTTTSENDTLHHLSPSAPEPAADYSPISGKQQLTDVEVADYLRISVSTVRRWRLLGDCGPRWIRIGSSIRYPAADLRAYVEGLPSGGCAGKIRVH